jgi:hypothetical protein
MEIFAKSKNGVDVYIDFEKSHAATHIKNHPRLEYFAKQIINDLVLTETFRKEYEMKETVGINDLVSVTPKDKIIYAKRINRDTYIPFVKDREAENTSILTMDIRHDGEKFYLYTIYIGGNTPGLPGGDREDAESREFWSTHAIVWGNQEIQEDSLTDKCPW